VASKSVLTQVPVIVRVHCDEEHIVVHLADGREFGIPLAWSERLSAATPAQRTNYEIEEEGAAIHWPDVDEDIGLSTFLGISEEALYAALGWESPTKSTEEYVALVEH
jgi:hypothetical protein